MPETAPVVALDNVSVVYGRNAALRGVTTAFTGGAVGLLGPNGAGKSTMIKALLGFVIPTSGQMRVLGLDVARSPLEIRARVGYMPESDAHIPGMNAVAFVAYCGELAGLPRVDATQRAHEVLFYVGLGEARYRNVETYSTGMKQRIKLAQALVHDPDLLFLDEPTNGMDPKGRDEMAGFLTAASLVRPSKSILDLEANSVIKRMKDKAFARAISRDDLRAGAELLGLPLADHITNCITFLRDRADALGLRGSL